MAEPTVVGLESQEIEPAIAANNLPEFLLFSLAQLSPILRFANCLSTSSLKTGKITELPQDRMIMPNNQEDSNIKRTVENEHIARPTLMRPLSLR